MMRTLAASLALALSLAAQTPIAPAKKLKLFSGKNLDGWYTYLRENKYEDPKRVFRVERGELVITGEEWGGIGTKEAYRDYHLVAEWRWGGPAHGNRAKAARDSGILIHGSGPDGAAGGVWLASIESQIIEGGTGDILPVAGKTRPSITAETRVGPDGQLYWQRGGKPETRDRGRINWFGRDVNWKDTLNYRGPQDVEKPTGKWNRHEVVCAGGKVTNIINGVVVSEGYDAKPAEGKIMIQSEGAEIRFRKIELRPVRKGR